MLRSLTSAVTGLRNFTVQLDVLGNNLANVRTLGFKASRVTFAEARSQVLSGQKQIGLGVNVSATDMDFTQGNLEFTGVPTDLAIQGNSFFVLNDGEENRYTRAGNFFFDSEGKLVNSGGMAVQGWMADHETGEIDTASAWSQVYLDKNRLSRAVATENAFLSGNLDASLVPEAQELSSALALRVAATGADVDDGNTSLDALTSSALVSGTSSIVISGTLSDGTAVPATTFTYGVDGTTINQLASFIDSLFSSGASASFDDSSGKIVLTDKIQDGKLALSGDLLSETQTTIVLSSTDSDLDNALPDFAVTTEGFSGIVPISATVYDSRGDAHNLVITFTNTEEAGEWTWEASLPGDESLVDVDGDGYAGVGTIKFDENGDFTSFDVEGTETGITIDPGNGAGRFTVDLDVFGGEGFSGVSQYAAEATLKVRSQDGRPPGSLLRFAIDDNGIIMGVFSNDETEALAQIALAEFPNPVGLLRSGDALFDVTTGSGTPEIGASGEEFNSSIISGSLEMSNVELVRQFTDMITTQRGFQANARVVTTADQILDETMRLKR